MELRERYRGALVGLAAGDALGTTLEFSDGDHKRVTTITGGGPFGLEAGQWTDDTSMALCLAESLVETVYVLGPDTVVIEPTREGAEHGLRSAFGDGEVEMVGARGFEPPTSSSRTMRATRLRHAPTEMLV